MFENHGCYLRRQKRFKCPDSIDPHTGQPIFSSRKRGNELRGDTTGRGRYDRKKAKTNKNVSGGGSQMKIENNKVGGAAAAAAGNSSSVNSKNSNSKPNGEAATKIEASKTNGHSKPTIKKEASTIEEATTTLANSVQDLQTNTIEINQIPQQTVITHQNLNLNDQQQQALASQLQNLTPEQQQELINQQQIQAHQQQIIEQQQLQAAHLSGQIVGQNGQGAQIYQGYVQQAEQQGQQSHYFWGFCCFGRMA